MKQGLLEAGFKILVAVMSGVAIFVAMGKGSQNVDQNQKPQNRPQQPQLNPQQNFPARSNNSEMSRGESILHGLRVGQDTCAKVSGFIQSLGSVTSSVMSIFGDRPAPTNFYQQQPYGNGNYIGDNMWRPNDFMIMPGPRNSGYGRSSYYDEANGRNPF